MWNVSCPYTERQRTTRGYLRPWVMLFFSLHVNLHKQLTIRFWRPKLTINYLTKILFATRVELVCFCARCVAELAYGNLTSRPKSIKKTETPSFSALKHVKVYSKTVQIRDILTRWLRVLPLHCSFKTKNSIRKLNFCFQSFSYSSYLNTHLTPHSTEIMVRCVVWGEYWDYLVHTLFHKQISERDGKVRLLDSMSLLPHFVAHLMHYFGQWFVAHLPSEFIVIEAIILNENMEMIFLVDLWTIWKLHASFSVITNHVSEVKVENLMR